MRDNSSVDRAELDSSLPFTGVVSLDDGEFEVAELWEQLAKLERQIVKRRGTTRKLVAVIRLQRAELEASGFSLENQRLAEAAAKARLLAAIGRSTEILRLVIVVRLLRLSSARYHAWRRAEKACELADRPSCPRTSPAQLTAEELATMKQMVTSEEYRHMPLRTVAVFAQRIGWLFASVST